MGLIARNPLNCFPFSAKSETKCGSLLPQEGICERCKGSGVQECSLCYGRGSIAQPGYVNVANAMHRRLCLRCGGNKTQTCQICGGAYQQGVDARNLLVSRSHERLHSASSTIPEQRADARRRHKRLDEDEFDEF